MSGYAAHDTPAGSCICGCGGGACIPQRKYGRKKANLSAPHEMQEMILFSVNGKCGYPLADALHERYTGLDERDEKMFVDSKSAITIRLEVGPSPLARPKDDLEPIRSGCCMRSGQDRSVPTTLLRGH